MIGRPRTAVVAAAFLFAATAIAAVVGISLLFPNPLLDRLWALNRPGEALFRRMGRISGLPLLLLAVGTFLAARGLLRRRKWAWWFAVALFAVDGSGDVVAFVITGDWLRSLSGVVITGIFLYCVTRPEVRRYFGQPCPAL